VYLRSSSECCAEIRLSGASDHVGPNQGRRGRNPVADSRRGANRPRPSGGAYSRGLCCWAGRPAATGCGREGARRPEGAPAGRGNHRVRQHGGAFAELRARPRANPEVRRIFRSRARPELANSRHGQGTPDTPGGARSGAIGNAGLTAVGGDCPKWGECPKSVQS